MRQRVPVGLRIAAVAAVSGLGLALAQARAASVTVIPDLLPQAISGDGTTVLGTNAITFQTTVWRASGSEIVQGVSGGRALSHDGNLAVGEAFTASGRVGWRWTRGQGWAPISAAADPVQMSGPYGLAPDASVIVGATPANTAGRWTAATGAVALEASGISTAKAVSDDGSVAAGSVFQGTLTAVVWPVGGARITLGVPGQSDATDVTADGSTVFGQYNLGTFEQVAFRWTAAGGAAAIPGLSGFTAASADGGVVLGSRRETGAPPVPVIWDAVNGVRDVSAVISAAGAAPPPNGWSPHGISADGAVILGSARDTATGTWRAYVIDLRTGAAPGACCTGTRCSASASQAECVGAYLGAGTTCDADPSNPTTCCRANFDGVGGVEVADIFAFLSAWFAQSPTANFDGTPAIEVADIFAFLSAWFAGC